MYVYREIIYFCVKVYRYLMQTKLLCLRLWNIRKVWHVAVCENMEKNKLFI